MRSVGPPLSLQHIIPIIITLLEVLVRRVNGYTLAWGGVERENCQVTFWT